MPVLFTTRVIDDTRALCFQEKNKNNTTANITDDSLHRELQEKSAETPILGQFEEGLTINSHLKIFYLFTAGKPHQVGLPLQVLKIDSNSADAWHYKGWPY